MSYFLFGNDSCGLEFLNNRWGPDAMRFTLANRGVVDSRDIESCESRNSGDRWTYGDVKCRGRDTVKPATQSVA
jgi:hypothetical protein